ncbi:hypothetical protein QMK33_19700 [Hymenobacter sp. H14-R3]|uniref:hypothetical protein n=1 Tax=Hymenobacter sp. H14-R3 TaxID=3046308 RepID=UPI0024B897F5|nr:hypothetical protein [Hymenobacter sp. H14-R3]MDJ0367379.1 hypothetical protein [Hymenobacter sp. H14-R3]
MTVFRQQITALEPAPKRRVVDTRDYVRWGVDDQRPQQLLALLANSGTGKVCATTKAKFIEGNGLKDIDFYQALINPRGQTMDALLKLLADRESKLSGHALLINLNLLGNPYSVYHLAAESVRLGIPLDDGTIDYVFQLHPKVPGSKAKAAKPTLHLVFDPREPAEQRAERLASWPGGPEAYPGEVYCSWLDEAGYYPEQVYEPVEVDMETEARLKRSRRTDIKSGYSDKTVITEYGSSSPTLEVMAANALKYGGFVGEDGDRIMLLYADSKDLTPDIKTISAPDASKRYATDGEALKADIRAVFQIPSLLYGEATAGKLGSSQEMEDATLYVQNMVVNTNQRSIERTLTAVFATFQRPDQPDVPLCPSDDYSIENLSLAAVAEVAEESEAQQVLKAINSLSPLVANNVLGAMSQKQKLSLIGLLVDGAPDTSSTTDGNATP